MKKILLLWICSLAVGPAFAQLAEEDAMLRYAETISANDLRAHIGFLADDLLEGRETGKRGQKMAAHYIRAQFQRFGLQPGNQKQNDFYQTFYLNRSRIRDAEISIGKSTFAFGKDFINFRSGMADNLEGEFVFAGYGIESDEYNNLSGIDVKDKIVVAFSGGPTPPEGSLIDQLGEWRDRQDQIEAKGAKALIMLLPDSVYKIVGRYTRRRTSNVAPTDDPGMSALYFSEKMGDALLAAVKADRARIQAQLAESAQPPAMKFKKLKINMTSDVERSSTPAENVLGFLEGTDKKDEILVLTAHYDHIGTRNNIVNNGADDDASGTSAIIELAEAFTKAAQAGYRPRRSILFMTVSGEEKGLLGSAFYTDYPIYPLEQTVTNLNIDMIGRIDNKYLGTQDSANYVYVIGSDKLSSELHEISEASNQAYTNLVLDYRYNDENDPNRFYYRSDHYNFAKNDIPVIFYFTGVHPDYHKPTDDPEKINYEKTAKIARLVFSTAWEVANRDERIVVDKKKD